MSTDEPSSTTTITIVLHGLSENDHQIDKLLDDVDYWALTNMLPSPTYTVTHE